MADQRFTWASWSVATIGTATVATGLVLAADHWAARFPEVPFGANEAAIWATGFASALILVWSGAWLRAAPRTARVGAWVGLAGVGFAGWLACTFWPSPLAPWVSQLLVIGFRTLLPLALLAWPVGRLDPQWRRPVGFALGGLGVLMLIAPFLGATDAAPPWGRADWMLPTIGSGTLGVMRDALVGVILLGVAPTVLLAAVASRRHRLPAAIRSALTPAFVGVAVLAIGDLWLFVSNVLARDLEAASSGQTFIGAARAVVDYGRFGLVGLMLVVGARSSGRLAAATPTSVIDVDGSDRGLSSLPSPVTVRFARPGGGWVDADGAVCEAPSPDALDLVDERGRRLAAVLAGPNATALDVRTACTSVAVDIERTRRRAEATARLAELRHLQLEVLARQDDARSRLERDLHDGAQQQLVALRIHLGLAARAGSPDSVEDLAGTLAEIVDTTRRLVAEQRIVVLDHGLSVGLQSLARTCPIECDVRANGDVDGRDPLAQRLWLIASEAISNVLKHAGASRVEVRLDAASTDVELSVSDDGRGGLATVPRSLLDRLGDDGHASLRSPPDGGTELVFTFPTTPGVTP